MESHKNKASGQKAGSNKQAISKQQHGKKEENSSNKEKGSSGNPVPTVKVLPQIPAPSGNITPLQVKGRNKHNPKPPGSPAPTGNVMSLQVQGVNKHNSKPRSSPAEKRTVTPVQGQGPAKQNAKLPGSPSSTENVTPLNGQGGDKQYTRLPEDPSSSEKIADVESLELDKDHARSETSQSNEDLAVSGTSVKNAFEDEVRRLKVENHFLKTILDHLHTNLFAGKALSQQELNVPEDLQNDQSILEFNSNAQKVARRFKELETGLDIIHTQMSKFSSTKAGDKEGKEETPSKDRPKTTAANGHIPERSPASTAVPSEHSLDLDSPVSKEKNGKESNIENVSSPMEEQRGVVPNLEGVENTGHMNITEYSDNTCARKDESKMYPTDRRHNVFERVHEVKEMIRNKMMLNSDLKEATTKLEDSQKLEEQVESLRMRLSELAGAKYTNNNANVTDLSDPNRPMKLAEQYSELYSNEWSDAFEQHSGRKQKHSEEKIIRKLLDILLAGFKYCKSIKDDQHSGLREIVLFPARDKAKKQINEENVEMNEVIVKHLTEAVKRSSEMTGEHIAKVFIKMKETKDMLKKGSESHDVYAQKCVKLCWLMQVQTPPVCIDLTAKPGDKFDNDIYRDYTKKGSKIDFIVWPPLRLHEGGPLLAKGVAQGKDDMEC